MSHNLKLKFKILTTLLSITTCASAQITPSPPFPFAGDFALKQGLESDSAVASPNGDLLAFRAFQFQSGSKSITSAIISYRQALRTGDTENYTPESVAQIGANAGRFSAGAAVKPSVSPLQGDGSYAVAFASNASDIVEGPEGRRQHIFLRVHGPTQGSTFQAKTVLVSARPSTGEVSDGFDYNPSVTVIPGATTSYRVAFYSNAYNLVDGIPPYSPNNPSSSPKYRIYVATITVDATGPKLAGMEVVSAITADADCVNPRISGDGESVVFESAATNLIVGENFPDSSGQIYLSKRAQNLRLITRTSTNQIGSNSSFNPVISHDGSAIAYTTYADNLVSGSANSPAIVICDLSKPEGSAPCTHQRVNVSSANQIGLGDVSHPPQILQATLSNGARSLLVAFGDFSDNLVPGDTNGRKDLFIKNIVSGEMIRAVVTTSGQQPNDDVEQPTLGALGSTIPRIVLGFASRATNLYDSTPPVSLNAYLSNITLSAPPPKDVKELLPIIRDTVRKTPPDVQVAPKTVVVNLPKFSLPSLRSARSRMISPYASASKRTKISYDVRLEKIQGRGRIQKITTRNRITLRKVTPGTYTVRYRVIVNRSSGRTVRTSFSPRTTVTVAT